MGQGDKAAARSDGQWGLSDDYSHVVSASSSFLRFIRSLRASASRRAIWIFCWMDSAFASAMPPKQCRRRQCPSQQCGQGRDGGVWDEVRRAVQTNGQVQSPVALCRTAIAAPVRRARALDADSCGRRWGAVPPALHSRSNAVRVKSVGGNAGAVGAGRGAWTRVAVEWATAVLGGGPSDDRKVEGQAWSTGESSPGPSRLPICASATAALADPKYRRKVPRRRNGQTQ
jgi:hypothetical protein